MSRIISFRGLMADGAIDTVALHTNDGKTGYRIVKFQIMPSSFNATDEYTIQLWKTPQTTAGSYQDFSNQTLLAVAYIETIAGAAEGVSPTVIFDTEIFNQDIYVTAKSQAGSSCNYYIELEQMDLALDESTVATLKDIRNTET